MPSTPPDPKKPEPKNAVPIPVRGKLDADPRPRVIVLEAKASVVFGILSADGSSVLERVPAGTADLPNLAALAQAPSTFERKRLELEGQVRAREAELANQSPDVGRSDSDPGIEVVGPDGPSEVE